MDQVIYGTAWVSPTQPCDALANGWPGQDAPQPWLLRDMVDPYSCRPTFPFPNNCVERPIPPRSRDETPTGEWATCPPSKQIPVPVDIFNRVPANDQLFVLRDGILRPVKSGTSILLSRGTDTETPQRHYWPLNDLTPHTCSFAPEAIPYSISGFEQSGFYDQVSGIDPIASSLDLPFSHTAPAPPIAVDFYGVLPAGNDGMDLLLDRVPLEGVVGMQSQLGTSSCLDMPQQLLNYMAADNTPAGVRQQSSYQNAQIGEVGSVYSAQGYLGLRDFNLETTHQQALTGKPPPQTFGLSGIDPTAGSSKSTSKLRHSSPREKRDQTFRTMDVARSIERRHEDSKELVATEYVFGKTQRVRSTLDSKAKNRVAKAREIGVCERCKRLKQACHFGESPYLPCDRCRTSNPSKLHMPCKLQASIQTLALFRLGPPDDNPTHPLMFFKHRQDLWQLPADDFAPEARHIVLSQGMQSKLKVTVSRFSPHPQDKIAYEWMTPEGEQRMEMMPYCISDITEAEVNMRNYLKYSKGLYLDNLVDRSSKILVYIFKLAIKSTSPMVALALRFWSAVRLIEHTWRLCPPETLGMSPISDPSNPWHDMIPVTPIMDQQLDQIVIHRLLVPMGKELLLALQKAVDEDRKAKKRWHEIFLTKFVLLHNCSIQLAEERKFARRYGMSGRYGPLGKYKDAENLFHTARTILAHFHFIYHGSILLSLEWKASGKTQGIDSDDEQDRMANLKKQISEQRQFLLTLREEHDYEKDMYWCHQLFYDEWDPGAGHIEELPEEERTIHT